jgi:hypothetical protein
VLSISQCSVLESQFRCSTQSLGKFSVLESRCSVLETQCSVHQSQLSMLGVEVLSVSQFSVLESQFRRSTQCFGQFSVLESGCSVLETQYSVH